MSHIPPYQPQSNGAIERMVGIVKEHMRKVLHGSKINEQFWSHAAMYVADVCDTERHIDCGHYLHFGEVVA
eukprot:9823418-Prorocentrum_lima.AAC.1